MDRINRAKQFMPFDALKGFREALAQKEREMLSPKKRKASAEEGKRGEPGEEREFWESE